MYEDKVLSYDIVVVPDEQFLLTLEYACCDHLYIAQSAYSALYEDIYPSEGTEQLTYLIKT